MRILSVDRFPETALAAIETEGTRRDHRPGITARGRLLQDVGRVREPAPELLLDAAVRS